MSFIYEILPDRIVSALGWTILHSLWQGLVIGILLFLLLYYYRYHSSNLKYNLSVFSLVLICGLFFLTFIMNYRTAGSIDYYLSKGVQVTGNFNTDVHLSQDFTDIQRTTTTGSVSSIVEAIPGTFPFIIIFWLLGVFIITIRMTGGFFITQRLRNSCLYAIPEEIKERFHKLAGLMKINKVVTICESTLIHVPVVIGYFKPIILLPFSALSHIPCDQIEAIIAHELAHIRRNDYLVNVFQSITEALFFYNPVIWIINHRIRKERENCCDDLAILYSDGRFTYAKALANIHDVPAKYGFPLLAAASNKYHLLSRVLRILKQGKMKTNFKDKLIAGFVLLSAIIIILLNTGGSFSNFNSTPDHPVQIDYFWDNAEKSLTANPVNHQDPENLIKKDQSLQAIENPVSKNLVEPLPVNEPGFSSLPEPMPVNDFSLDVLAPVHPDTTLNVKDNVVRRTFIKDGIEMNIEMRIENGKVRELYVNADKIPEDNYGQYQAEIDKTLEDLAELQEELTEAREELEEVDMEEIRKDIEESMEEVRKSLSEIDIEAMIPDIEEIEIPEIDEENIRIEIENALAEIEAIDMEKIHREIEIAVESACEAIKDIEMPDMEEIKAEIKVDIEMAKKELEEIDFEEIRADIEKSISEIKIDHEAIRKEMEEAMKELEEINIDDIKIDLEREKNKMDEMLKELEKLEIKK